MKNKNGFVAIPLIILALISIAFGIGYAMQRQSKNALITTQNESPTSSGAVDCQCDVQRGDLLTKEDVLNIILENKTMMKGDKGDSGLQGPKGEKGDKGEPGPQGSIGSTGPKGERGNDGTGITGEIRKFCSAEDGVEPYYNNDAYCLSKKGGEIIEIWTK